MQGNSSEMATLALYLYGSIHVIFHMGHETAGGLQVWKKVIGGNRLPRSDLHSQGASGEGKWPK